ncbi:MAG: dihydropteroate synthase [Gammaproteobacteria bacterium]|nr:dihydropteroate synthase [Gammaproteobacteria bacterium]
MTQVKEAVDAYAPELAWGTGRLVLDRPRVMGIVNVTPDSFSDGGRYLEPQAALDQAFRLAEEGAAIIDVGGESTRPGAAGVDADEEMRRVVPVIERLAADLQVPVSVDTSRPEIMRAATAAGAVMVNDVRALGLPGALEAVLEADCALCLMHMQGTPATMQDNPHYGNVVEEVCDFLEARADACVDAGVPPDHIVLDPGFGFGKTREHNLVLLRQLGGLLDLGYPLLVGLSRKSIIGSVTRVDTDGRLAGSLAAATLAGWLGASIIRAHDVHATVQALAVMHATRREEKEEEGSHV